MKEVDCDEAYVHVLPETTFLSCGQHLMTLEDGHVVADASYQAGIEPEQPSFLWQIAGITGSWPGAAWLATNRTTETAARAFVYRWSGQRWEQVAAAKPDEPLSAILPWSEQRALALLEPPLAFGARRGTLLVLDDLPELPPRAVWEVTALVAVSPAEVLLAARASVDATRAVSYFARWDGASFHSVPVPFPVWAPSPTDVWILTRHLSQSKSAAFHGRLD